MPDSSEGTCQPEAFLYPLRAAEELVDLRDRGSFVGADDSARAEEIIRDLARDEADYPYVGQ